MKVESWKVAALSLLPALYIILTSLPAASTEPRGDTFPGRGFEAGVSGFEILVLSIPVFFLRLPKTRVLGAGICVVYSVGFMLLTQPQINDLINPAWMLLYGLPITCLMAACIIALCLKV